MAPKITSSQTSPIVRETHDLLLSKWRLIRAPQLAEILQGLASDDWLNRVKKIRQMGREDLEKALPELLTEDDPRLTVFLLEALQKPLWPSSGFQDAWTVIFARIVSLSDVRALSVLASVIQSPPHFVGIKHSLWMLSQVARCAIALELRCKQLPQLDSESQALIAQYGHLKPLTAVSKKPSTEVATALLNPVWKNPTDDSIRLVLADALLEQNDPWGEFISLQFCIANGTASTAQIKRATTLLNKYESHFSGPIGPVCNKQQLMFENGFLVRCAVNRSMVPKRRWEEAAVAPHWATVKSVRIDDDNAPLWWVKQWAQNTNFKSLVSVTFVERHATIKMRRETTTAVWRISDVLSAAAPPNYPRTDRAEHFLASVAHWMN
jgi:uncharacterized protein (TIGR02996 family)